MDEEQKRIVVIVGIIAFLIFSTLIVCTKRRSTPSSANKFDIKNEFAQEEKFIQKQMLERTKKAEKSHPTPSHGSSYSAPSTLTPPTFTNKRIEENKKILQAARENQKKAIKQSVLNTLKDPKAPPAKVLRARLVTSKSYVTAFTAYKKEDYKTAAKSYYEVFKDKESTVEMKYIALEGLQQSAKKLGDLDLYLIATQELGKLVMANDIPLLSVKKSPDYYEWSLMLTAYMQARKDNSVKEKIIEDAMADYHIDREEAERITNERIQEYEILFKELVS